MSGLNGAAIFVVQTLGSLYLLVVLLRFILQLVRANFYNPICQFIVKATQTLLKPMRRVIPSIFGLDMSSMVLAILVQMVVFAILLIEAMTNAGVKLGLSHDVAEKLAEHTALGAACMAVDSDADAAELRRRVTSPAGTTEAAIKSFQASGFEATVEKALSAAAHRSAELAKQVGQ